jgi:GNAT superfamily N-acetyltransferase
MRVRVATEADLPLIAAIEAAADRMFDAVVDTSGWGEPDSGEERAAEPGFLLVVGEPVVGFAHVLDLDGRAHLEQLAVLPGHTRQGLGTALVEAACREAAARGHDQVTLRTYADVPWNGPFYARLGFVEIPDQDWMAPMLATEARIGLPRSGRRIAMARRLS